MHIYICEGLSITQYGYTCGVDLGQFFPNMWTGPRTYKRLEVQFQRWLWRSSLKSSLKWNFGDDLWIHLRNHLRSTYFGGDHGTFQLHNGCVISLGYYYITSFIIVGWHICHIFSSPSPMAHLPIMAMALPSQNSELVLCLLGLYQTLYSAW